MDIGIWTMYIARVFVHMPQSMLKLVEILNAALTFENKRYLWTDNYFEKHFQFNYWNNAHGNVCIFGILILNSSLFFLTIRPDFLSKSNNFQSVNASISLQNDLTKQ